MRQFLKIAAIVGGMLVPPSLLIGMVDPIPTLMWLGDGITRGGAALAAAAGVYPPDVVRLLIGLMAFHYAMEIPAAFGKLAALWKSKITRLRKIAGSVGTLGHFTMRIVVPVLFCLIVEGHLLATNQIVLGA